MVAKKRKVIVKVPTRQIELDEIRAKCKQCKDEPNGPRHFPSPFCRSSAGTFHCSCDTCF
jgi:hypothetical protein